MKRERPKLFIKIRESIRAMIEESENLPHIKLPSERVLCEQFEVNRLTLRKALASLREEGLIAPVQRRGTLVRNQRSSNNTAVVYGSGQAYQLVSAPEFYAETISTLSRMQRNIRLMNCPNPERLPELCRKYAVSSLFWLEPTKEVLPVISKLRGMSGLSFAAHSMNANFFPSPEEYDFQNFFLRDLEFAGKSIARFLRKKGYGRIAFFGYKTEKYTAFAKEMERVGCPQAPAWCVERDYDISSCLPGFLDNHDFEAIVSDGGDRYAELFDFLSGSDRYGDCPLFLSNQTPYLKFLSKRFTGLNIIGVGDYTEPQRIEPCLRRLVTLQPGELFATEWNRSYEIGEPVDRMSNRNRENSK